MAVETAAFLIGVGLVGGVWNAIAGGATLFTFPALMLVGLPPIVANATDFLAMMPSNAAAIPAYRRELAAVGSALWPLLAISGLGAAVGSVLLLVSDPGLFERLIPLLILGATLLFAFGDRVRRFLTGAVAAGQARHLTFFALFLFSIYGGYFGAGLGIILLAIVQLLGFQSFHVANSLKNVMATFFTALSILIFGVGGVIAWPEAVAMMIGSGVGGYVGGRVGRRIDERYLRGAVIVFGLVLSVVYFIQYWPGATSFSR